METDCAPAAKVVPLCQSHHAADSLLHPGHTHPPLAAGTHRTADGEDSRQKCSKSTKTHLALFYIDVTLESVWPYVFITSGDSDWKTITMLICRG